MSKVRISAVSYLNTKPFLYGIRHSGMEKDIKLSLDTPSVCAEKLLQNRVDIGLVPIAILPELREYYILSDYCIGGKGTVQSVLLLSEVKLDELKNILLDYQSRTSVLLTRILADRYWNINPQWIEAQEGYEKQIKGATGGIVIGDRALQLRDSFPYQYDLSEEWYTYTGLSFVFACWTANKKLPSPFLEKFEKAIAFGIQNKEKAIEEWTPKTIGTFNVQEYLKRHISYELDEDKKRGMNLFLNYINELQKEPTGLL